MKNERTVTAAVIGHEGDAVVVLVGEDADLLPFAKRICRAADEINRRLRSRGQQPP